MIQEKSSFDEHRHCIKQKRSPNFSRGCSRIDTHTDRLKNSNSKITHQLAGYIIVNRDNRDRSIFLTLISYEYNYSIDFTISVAEMLSNFV